MTPVGEAQRQAEAQAPGEGPVRDRSLSEFVSAVSSRAGALWTLGVLVIIVLAFTLTTSDFLSKNTWVAISLASTEILMLALGETFVIISRGIDLSVGAVLGMAGMVSGLVMEHLVTSGASATLTIAIGAAVCIAVGAVAGLANGIIITQLKISPFVTTLGMLGIATGITQLINGGNEISTLPNGLEGIGNNSLLSGWLPIPVLVTVIFALVTGVLLHRLRFGRRTYAIGSNPDAALRTGINVNRHLVLVYLLSGTLAGVAGFIVTAQLDVASQQAGQNDELSAIAAVVIGGASLFGGRGTMAGSVIGTLIVSVLGTGLIVANVAPAWQVIAIGVILILAVWADQQRLRLAQRA